MSAPLLYAVDIETDTTPCHEPAQECCDTRGLDPFRSSITEIVIKGDGVSVVLDDADGEVALLKRFRHLMLGLPAGVVATWNGSVFDAPWLHRRALLNSQPSVVELAHDPTIPVKYSPTPGYLGGYRAAFGPHRHLDVTAYYTRALAESIGVRHSLKPVGEYILGIKPVVVDRTKMHELSAAERLEYVTSDGTLTVGLAREIPDLFFQSLIDVPPALLMAG